MPRPSGRTEAIMSAKGWKAVVYSVVACIPFWFVVGFCVVVYVAG